MDWLDNNHYYPSRVEALMLADQASLTQPQVHGWFFRARQTNSWSHRAVNLSYGKREMSEISSNHFSEDNRERAIQVEGTHDGYVPDYPILLSDHNSSLDWWFRTILAHNGSHFDYPHHHHQQGYESFRLASDRCHPSGSGCSLSGVSSSGDSFLLVNGSMSVSAADNDIPGRRCSRRSCAKRKSSAGAECKSNCLDNIYYCTFKTCHEIFSSLSAWKRHENEKHIHPPRFICQPSVRTLEGILLCSFCGQNLADDSCAHKVKSCWSRKKRAFQRRQHLREHLVRFHRLEQQRADEISASVEVNSDTSFTDVDDRTCFFCGIISESWEERQDHVGEHFQRESRTGSEWDACKEATLRSRLIQGST